MTIDEIYTEFEGRLRGYAITLTKDSFRADDLVQETFIRAMTNLHLLESLAQHQRRAWLRRTLKNLFIDEQRSWQRQENLVIRLSNESDSVSHIPQSLIVQDLLGRLPKKDGELLHKRYILGMNSRQIGEEIGVPAATVRSRIHHAIKRIRASGIDNFR